MITLFALIALSVIWGYAGWQLCKSTHRTRGVDVDPGVPAFVPSGWDWTPLNERPHTGTPTTPDNRWDGWECICDGTCCEDGE